MEHNFEGLTLLHQDAAHESDHDMESEASAKAREKSFQNIFSLTLSTLKLTHRVNTCLTLVLQTIKEVVYWYDESPKHIL